MMDPEEEVSVAKYHDRSARRKGWCVERSRLGGERLYTPTSSCCRSTPECVCLDKFVWSCRIKERAKGTII